MKVPSANQQEMLRIVCGGEVLLPDDAIRLYFIISAKNRLICGL